MKWTWKILSEKSPRVVTKELTFITTSLSSNWLRDSKSDFELDHLSQDDLEKIHLCLFSMGEIYVEKYLDEFYLPQNCCKSKNHKE